MTYINGSATLRLLSEMFEENKIKKIFVCCLCQNPNENLIEKIEREKPDFFIKGLYEFNEIENIIKEVFEVKEEICFRNFNKN